MSSDADTSRADTKTLRWPRIAIPCQPPLPQHSIVLHLPRPPSVTKSSCNINTSYARLRLPLSSPTCIICRLAASCQKCRVVRGGAFLQATTRVSLGKQRLTRSYATCMIHASWLSTASEISFRITSCVHWCMFGEGMPWDATFAMA